jgi:hypothetical protein
MANKPNLTKAQAAKAEQHLAQLVRSTRWEYAKSAIALTEASVSPDHVS